MESENAGSALGHAVSALHATLAIAAVIELSPDQRRRAAAAYLEFQDRFRAILQEAPVVESVFVAMQAADQSVLQTIGVNAR